MPNPVGFGTKDMYEGGGLPIGRCKVVTSRFTTSDYAGTAAEPVCVLEWKLKFIEDDLEHSETFSVGKNFKASADGKFLEYVGPALEGGRTAGLSKRSKAGKLFESLEKAGMDMDAVSGDAFKFAGIEVELVRTPTGEKNAKGYDKTDATVSKVYSSGSAVTSDVDAQATSAVMSALIKKPEIKVAILATLVMKELPSDTSKADQNAILKQVLSQAWLSAKAKEGAWGFANGMLTAA